MPSWAHTPYISSIVIAALCVSLIVFLLVRRWRRRLRPEEIERRRRQALQRNGKIGDGEIIDFEDQSILYKYSVAGVVYTATQDLATLGEILPDDLITLIGPASLKFDPRNPANSIVLSEDWSGVRNRESPGKPTL